MATQIKLRRDTYQNWYDNNPVLGLAEPGFDTTNKKLKIGDGTTAWRSLAYFDDQETNLTTVAQNILPDADNTRDIGSPSRRWRHGYFATGSLYVGDLKLSNDAGTLKVQRVTNAGLQNEAAVPNTPGVVTTDRIVNGANTFAITAAGALELNGSAFTGSGSGSAAELIGDGYYAGSGYKFTVYTDWNGYQGGENNPDGEFLESIVNKDTGMYAVGDSITFRNGEQRTITEIVDWDTNQWLIKWAIAVPGGELNPRFPIIVKSSDYSLETKPTARIKPDAGYASQHLQYMKIYAGGGQPAILSEDSLHIHMAGGESNVELFLGTDDNYVSAKEAGRTPAGVNLHSQVDVSVVDTDLRLTRKGSSWVSVYGDGENVNLHNNTYDLSWSTVTTDDHGDYYVGGEANQYAEAIVSKFSRDGQLLWSKYNNGQVYDGWQFDGVAYHNGQVATLVQTDFGRSYNYYKLTVLDSDTGDAISTTDIYDPDGRLEAHSMIHHSTLGWTIVGDTRGEKATTGAITDTNNPNNYDAIRLPAASCLIDGQLPANGSGWNITGTNITGVQALNNGVGYFVNRPVTAVTGSGVDATVNVYIDYNAGTYGFDYVSSAGSGFAVGDSLKILGSQLGGADGTNDFTFTCQSNGGLTVTNNPSGTPSLEYIWIDMYLTGGYIDVAFKAGTFTLSKTRSRRPWIWTASWQRFLNPTPDAGNIYASGHAFCVAEDPITQELVVGGYIDTVDHDGTLVWKINAAGSTQWAKIIQGDDYNINGIAVSGVDSSIYASTEWTAIHKLSSSGSLIKTVVSNGPWGVTPEVKLAIEDGVEYVYAGGQGGSMWMHSSGFYLNKLTTDLESVWGRTLDHFDDSININYDIQHATFVLGNGQASMVGYGYIHSNNNTNALIYTLSTSDQWENFEDPNGWRGQQRGDQTYAVSTNVSFSMYDIITAGAQALTATAQTAENSDSLAWTNYAFQSQVVNLNTTQQGIVGVETIEFADGGTLDHNPADIPPSQHFDPNNTGWEYTLRLSDRGRFILNQTVPNDSNCQNLTVYVPRNDDVAFPVGTVITLINSNSSNGNGYKIYVRSIDYADGDGWARIWSTEGNQNASIWSFQGIQTATLMKISTNAWLLTANNLTNED